ncbi:hypothetical protein [Nitratireductor sp. XY-223]|uniref:hypothetical protein n=1 Tax=Nitratireductor sp. XY-223 TaxID=2561926 RepID=UPI0010AA0A9B|nr:hypothetical protein [Nitratireductor sp. XY-223]
MTDQIVRRYRRIFSGASEPRQKARFSKHQAMYDKAAWIVRFYYMANLYFVYNQLAGLREDGLSSAVLDPLWPVIWVKWVGVEQSSLIILHISIVAGFVGMMFWQYRSARLLVVVSQLLVAAFSNSFGSINHGFHEWFWIGVCFLFLPARSGRGDSPDRATRLSFLMVFSLAQALILLFYSLSGFYKVAAAAGALVQGEVGGFSPDAMAITLANRMLQTGTDAIWAPFIIENAWVGWPLYLGLYYIELVAIFVFLRPELHRTWGLMLIAFHFGTFLFMAIPFPPHVLINAMLFYFSPFAPDRFDWRAALRQLPVFGLAFRPLLAEGGRAAVATRPSIKSPT